MDSYVEVSLRQFLQTRPDLFGEQSEYLHFEIDPKYSKSGGYNANIIFGSIIYRRGNEKNRSKSLFLKLTRGTLNIHPDSEISHFMNEILFYSCVLPFFNSFKSVDSYFPEFFDSCLRINAAKKDGVIIFENLQTSGYRLAEKVSFLDYAHLSLMSRKLGNFHAWSFKAKKEDPTRFRILCDLFVDTITPRFRNFINLIQRLSKSGLRNLRQDPQYSSRIRLAEKMLDTTEEFMERLLRGDRNNFESVLCHGDYLRGNVIFKYDNGNPMDMKMIDMATCTLGSPVLDLSFLYLNASQQMREEHWDDLINEYYAGLTEFFDGIPLPSKVEILGQFRGRSLFAYLIASYFLRTTISTDHNLESLEDHCRRKYENVSIGAIPQEEFYAILQEIGGTMADEALQDILKDMLDRGFV